MIRSLEKFVPCRTFQDCNAKSLGKERFRRRFLRDAQQKVFIRLTLVLQFKDCEPTSRPDSAIPRGAVTGEVPRLSRLKASEQECKGLGGPLAQCGRTDYASFQ
jgi:hypothetical protein